MVCDLDYFNESDLDRTNMKDFYDNLPCHLQSKFRASLHGIQIGEGNVLQGYRGPSEMCNGGSGDSKELKPSHGLQEIKFWWGARKAVNFIPIVGTIIYTGCRTAQSLSGNLDWSSLYFDSHTGECLSHDKHEAVEKLKSRRRKAKLKKQASASNYDSDQDSEHREELAEDSDFQEDESFSQRKNIRAKKYARNYQKAQIENDARERFHEGNRLYMLGRYEEAEAEFRSAYHMSDVESERRLYKQCTERAHIEKHAMWFNFEANDLFHKGKFEDAICCCKRAIEISQVDERIQEYRTNIAYAQDEIYALNLNSQGNALFNEGRYWEALSEYRLASQKSRVGVRIEEYSSNVAKAQVEVDALELNSEGHNFLNQGRCDDAISMYLEARATSKVSAQRKQYEANADKAKAEANATLFNYQGNNLFKDGYYTAALSRYQEACKTSERVAQLKIYRDNLAKAQVEIDALKLNAQGDSFFNAGRYNEAVKIYLEAKNKSQTTKQKDMYLSNSNKAQDIMNKLNTLDTLWKQAWAVENDTKTDRSAEAKDRFQKILSEFQENLKSFPGNTKFEQFNALAALKIEGNELFNEGVNSQENGVALFKEALVLNQQQKYQLAIQKFKEANKYFQGALEMFEKGSNSDQRFTPCVEFVQEKTNEVIESIKFCEQGMLSAGLQKLDIHFDCDTQRSDTDIRKFGDDGNDKQYSQHI